MKQSRQIGCLSLLWLENSFGDLSCTTGHGQRMQCHLFSPEQLLGVRILTATDDAKDFD